MVQPEKVKGKFKGEWIFHIVDLEKLANGDIVTNILPGFPGNITKTYFVVGGDPVTTAAKLATLHVEINALAIVGGVLSLTSANCTPMGAVVEGTAVTGSNSFDSDDTISVVAASVTAFVEGDGSIHVQYEGKVL
jgi:hypothetical protein